MTNRDHQSGAQGNRMRIVHMTTIPVSLGFFTGQSRFYRSRGYAPLYVSSPGPDLEIFRNREDAETLAVPMQRSISPFADLVTVRKLVSVFRKERPVIVHAHTPKGGLLGMISARLARVPVLIYQIHGFPYMGLSGLKRQLLMWTERVSCFLADEVLCVSPSIRDVAIADRIVPASKIKVIGNGSSNGLDAAKAFNPANFDPDATHELRAELGIGDAVPLVTFVGRLANDKGIRELLAAWRKVHAETSDAVLLLVGTQDERDPLPETLIAEAEANPSVVLAGRRSDVHLIYAASDVIVLPTYREGYPTVLLEAAAMAKPVVATSVPGCIDAVVDGETGILIPVREVGPLATAILDLVGNPAKRQALGNAARIRVLRDYRPEDLWAGYAEEYERLLTRNGLSVLASKR